MEPADSGICRRFGRVSGKSRARQELRLGAPDLEQILARTDTGRGPAAVLRLTDTLCWRILPMSGMEGHFHRIRNILDLPEEYGPSSAPRLILAGAGEPGGMDGAGGSREARAETGELWERMEAPGVHVYIRPDLPDSICQLRGCANPGREDAWLASVLLPVYLRVIDEGGMILHAAAVERNGEAVLLAGKAGAGKSTACGRIMPPWRVLCDDLCLAVPSSHSGYFVHPLPTWSDLARKGESRRWEVSRGARLHGIFFLEREEETKALSLAKPDAAVRLWRTAVEGMIAWRQGLVRDRRRRLELRLLETAMHTAKGVGSFRLRLAREGVFRKEIERALAASPA